ncbi:YTH domain-containing protein ECT4 [Lactuca sativa]|uniref:YTH domain-containing family protein n=1 Tax=Lactuca sativa TaxID=4236 RepID=A0A9R1UJM1_LACSA|nr:YTH domain-containing protein ECT4 [Lactuca sativa]KAJ0188238.1 hypothetical protein LSAT_V11C900504620 [Lactuca sativa]
MPGDKMINNHNAVSSVIGKGVTDQSEYYPPTICYDHHHPGNNKTYNHSDGSCHQNSSGASFMDNNGSLLYFMPGYNPYAGQTFLGVDGQNRHFPSSEGMPRYLWNSAYSDAGYQNSTSWGSKSAMVSNGLMKSNAFSSQRFPNYLLDDIQSTSNISQSFLQTPQLYSVNKSGGVAKGYQQCSNFSSFPYQNQGLFANYSMIHASKVRDKSYSNGESEELTCGPRAQSSKLEHQEFGNSFKSDQYNLDGFQTKYEQAKFYIIKSYSEDDVHKCVKYDVWSSTPNGNKKLDIAFLEAEGKRRETGSMCPVFLFFSVNGSGQFVGVAEMTGRVVFEKDMDFWQLDKWSGFFPLKWHIIKDIPNTQLRHIILENNDNRPVTYTRDTQEVGLQQGLEMLDIFKSYPSKTSLLDDLSFYENREKSLKARRIHKVAFQPERNLKSGEGSMSTNGSLDPTSSLINLRNLSLS